MNIEEFKTKKEELRKAMEKDGQKLITELFQKAFDEIPSLQSIEWTQYTPYFNDGDACVFGVHEQYFGFKNSESKEEYDGDPYEDPNKFTTYSFKNIESTKEYYSERFKLIQNLKLSKKQIAVMEEIENAANEFEDLFQIAFGDHVSIKAIKNKKNKIEFEIEDYNHD